MVHGDRGNGGPEGTKGGDRETGEGTGAGGGESRKDILRAILGKDEELKELLREVEERYDELIEAFEGSEEFSKDPPGYLMTLKERLSLILGEEKAAVLILLLNSWDSEISKELAKDNKKLRELLLKYGEKVRLRSRLASWEDSSYKMGVALVVKSISQATTLAIRIRFLKSNLEPVTVDLPIDEYVDFLLNVTEPLMEGALQQYLKNMPQPLKEIWLKKIENVKERLSIIEKALGEGGSSFM